MSLVTRCPSCATTFKVVRDQLRISDGWVRCGRCSHVFDATIDLQDTADTVPAAPAVAPPNEGGNVASAEDPDPLRAPEPEPIDRPASQSTASWPDLGLVDDAPAPAPVLAQASLATSIEALADFSAAVERASDAQPRKDLRDARMEAVRAGRARQAAQAAPAASPAVSDAPPVLSMPVVAMASATEADLSPASPAGPALAPPVRPAGQQARRVVIAAVAACLLLVLQVLRHERDAIVARHPSWRPVFQALCTATGCELSALRQISAITIDGASFAREKIGDGYRLSFTLRNTAAVPLATPAVELSLFDTQERTVVRRVLAPAEFGASAVLATRTELGASLSLALHGPEAAALLPVAGFGVVAFYP